MVGLPRESRISRAATSSMVVKSFVLFGINKSSAIAMYLHGSVVLLIVHPRQISRLLLHPCGPIVHRGRVVEQVKNNGRARFISPWTLIYQFAAYKSCPYQVSIFDNAWFNASVCSGRPTVMRI